MLVYWMVGQLGASQTRKSGSKPATPRINMDGTGMYLICCLFAATLWLFNIAMEHGPFIDGLPIENGDFPWQTVK